MINIQPNDTFNKWTVIEEVDKTTARRFRCKCTCGNESIVRIDGLTKGTSSGCRNCAKKATTHGDTGKRLHTIWMGIRNRCEFKEHYENISRCNEWDNYATFKQWALNNGYTDTLEIDRIDVQGNYEPKNCRWVTETTQAQNTRLIYKSNTSGYRGVGFHKKANKWRAIIKKNGKQIALGYFHDKHDAAQAYNDYAIANSFDVPLNKIERW